MIGIRTIGFLLLAASASAHAAAGAYEINQDCAAVGCFAGDAPGFPVTISQPGRYVLTSDLVASGALATVNMIDGGASSVDLDLGGHVIEGGQTCTGTPVTSCTQGPGYFALTLDALAPMVLHLHDGRIHGFNGGGVFASNVAEGTVVERVVVTESNFGVGLSGRTATTTMRVRDCELSRNALFGATAANTGGRLFVENSALVGNKSDGIDLDTGAIAVGNRIESNGGYGVSCTVCALGQNVFYGNKGGGANPQWSATTVRDMGGNTCVDDGTCP